MSSVDETVVTVVCELAGIGKDRVRRESRFVQDLGVDSIVALEIISRLEENYSIEIDEERIKDFQTVGDLIDFLAQRVRPKD